MRVCGSICLSLCLFFLLFVSLASAATNQTINHTSMINYTFVVAGQNSTNLTNMTFDQSINYFIDMLLFIPETFVNGITYAVTQLNYFVTAIASYTVVFVIVGDIFFGLPPVIISVLTFSLLMYFIGNVLLGLRM